MKQTQATRRGRPLRPATLALLSLLLLPCAARGQWTTAGTNTMTTTNSVGIGTAPAYGKLQVNKSVRIDDDSASTTGSDVIGGAPNLYIGTTAGGNQLQYNSGGGLDLWQYNSGWRRTLTFARTGFVGVGTTSPASPLDVVYGDNNFGFGVNVTNTNTGTQALAGFGLNNASGSRVGQFTYASPSYTAASLRDTVLFSSVGATAKLGFVSSADGSGSPDIYFRAGGAQPDSLYIQGSTGNVGVGTNAPGYKLDVAGAINASGAVTGSTINATYQDVAEWVPSVQRLAAGTVVVLDVGRANHVVASTAAYDTKVAGVVSEQPGVILGVAGEGKVKVATTGRVRVRAEAARGAIKVGDLLVTSDVAGVAMRSVPVELGGAQIHRPGTIIGKALEPLERGSGEILVLLSLQ